MKKIVIVVLLAVLIVAVLFAVKKCNRTPHVVAENKLCATIPPVKYIIETITGGDFDIELLLPPGTSPETYEPTPLQMRSIADSKQIFAVGLIDFEQGLMSRFSSQTGKVVDLSEGVTLIEGEHTHGGSHSSHNHGVGPHIWSSPEALRQMAANAYGAIAWLYPDSARYATNYRELLASIDSADLEIKNIFAGSDVKYFIIYHPALTYYADYYGIEQIALEQEGKEPSAAQIKRIVDLARKDSIYKVFYQREFSRSMVETVANDIGARIIEIDPLAEDVLDNLISITRSIAEE